MEPVFIYYDKVEFQNNYNVFKVDFSDGDNIRGVFFRKNRDYHIASMSCFITLTQDLKELAHYDDIKKISEISNKILKNGIEHLYEEKILEANFNDVAKYEFQPEKINRGLSVKAVEFFDEVAKRKRLVYVYSPYEELKNYGLKFQNKQQGGIITNYTIDMIEENNKIYLQKDLFLDKKRVINEIIKENDRKNVIFFKYNLDGKIYAIKLEITKNYYSELKKKNNINFQSFIFKTLFADGKIYKYLIEKISLNANRYPIIITDTGTVIYGGVDIYLSPELYTKNKSFLRKLREIGQANVTSSMLTRFRTQLNDQDYSVSKIFGFRLTIPFYNVVFKKDDFVLPDFKIDMTIKSPTTVNDVFKKILEFSYSLLDKKTKIKEVASEKLEDDLQGQSGYIKKLSQKANLKSLTHAYENFFLYDLDNVIKPTFTTELQKEFSIYGLISFSGETKKDNKLELVSPQNKLKFEMIKDIYKNDMKSELSKVHTKKTFNVVDNHILNFGILQTKKHKRVGEKRAMAGEIIDTVPILGIQNTEYNFLNPVYISINSDTVIQKLTKYKNYRYRFVLQSILFSSNKENETDVILIVSNGLNNAKKALIKKGLETNTLQSTLGVCYLTEIKDWEIIKGQSKRLQAVFSDSEDIGAATSHFAFAFTTKNISDLLNFSVMLVAGNGEIIKFPFTEKKIPIISFKIQIIK